jgi:MFS family permease
MYGISAGIFLAVDWALMTDIIPKASSGRYMGLSNVATASAGVLAIAVGGTIIDLVGGGEGPRTALWMSVGLMALGALLLRPVSERRREDPIAPEPAVAVSPGVAG